MQRAFVGVTGASGSAYADAFVRALLAGGWHVRVAVTACGSQVMAQELGMDAETWFKSLGGGTRAVLDDDANLLSPAASGSHRTDAAIIIPCSMATLGQIASGTGKNLVCRAADVALKEGRRLLLVPRETPLNAVHLENMLRLARLGAGILPAMPAFYGKPRAVEDMVNFIAGRALDWLGVEHELYARWGEPT